MKKKNEKIKIKNFLNILKLKKTNTQNNMRIRYSERLTT